ncbi:DUF5946 family protein [Modestobacter altitudinis]|uniref:DUF5946 family protein n=1 Tax=Modestobacter altitudinis TaxID=2213158 RepID=UPI00110C9BC2|nr:DUF5946 family protein [Modestobacter altitudinis]
MSDADTRADTATADPAGSGWPETEVCPGCGAVTAAVPGLGNRSPGASASCAGLFEVTVRGLQEDAAQDVPTAALLQLATDGYAAQHPVDGEPAAAAVRLCLWLERGTDPLRAAELAGRVDDAAPRLPFRPVRWTTTVADLAADLDVVDLPALVRSWADAVWTDWGAAHPAVRAAADAALPSPDAAR